MTTALDGTMGGMEAQVCNHTDSPSPVDFLPTPVTQPDEPTIKR